MSTFNPNDETGVVDVKVSEIRISYVMQDGETIRIDREVSDLTHSLVLPAEAAVEIQRVIDRWEAGSTPHERWTERQAAASAKKADHHVS